MGTVTTFDLDRFTRAAEERDAATQLSMYGPDAVVTITNKISQPGAPRVLRTREEIKGWLEDTYSREMTHKVKHRVHDDTALWAAWWVFGLQCLTSVVFALLFLRRYRIQRRKRARLS